MIQRSHLLLLVLVSLSACGGDDAPITIDAGNDAGGVGGDGAIGGTGGTGGDAGTGEMTCGNRVREGNELCDDGGRDGYCNDTCDEIVGFCGDGIVQSDVEGCDTGNPNAPRCQGCRVALGSRCEGEPSRCGPRGLNWDKPLEDYTRSDVEGYCTWLISTTFGREDSISCPGGITLTPLSVSECANRVGPFASSCVAPILHLLECSDGVSICDQNTAGPANDAISSCQRQVCMRICEPNSWSCSGNIAHHCNQWGNAYEDTECGTGTCDATFPNPINASQICGLAICAPNTWSCNGNTAQLCAPDALSYTRTELCGAATCVSGGPDSTPIDEVCEIDECTSGANNCDINATCTNTPGSFTCACNTGYEGDGTSCTDINECANYTDNCDPNALCANTAGGFTCTCTGDYTGSGTTCLRDECALNLNNCSPNATCVDQVTDFYCTCANGYAGDGITCNDVNECANSTDNCDHSPSACVNTDGSYSCVCPDGYTGDGIASTGCTDINECFDNSDECGDNADCINVPGSYTCGCRAGYAGDGISCLPLAYLNDITLSAGTLAPTFDANTLSYTVSVPLGTQSLSITPSTTTNVEIRVNGALVGSGSASSLIALDPGLNTVSVVLSGPDHATNTYTLLISRGTTASTYVKASNTGTTDQFGTVVAISGDTMVVGVPFEDGSNTNTGAVYVFERVGGLWSQQALLRSPTQSASGFFGGAVDVSGDTIVVGERFNDDNLNDSGAAHVYARSGVTWTHQQTLKADNAGNYDLFGSAVAINGDSIVVGAPGEDSGATGIDGDQANNSATNSGAVYLFHRSGSSWTQQAYVKASNTELTDEFGRSIALHDDTLAVGVWNEDGALSQGDNDAPNSGAVYVFTRGGATWSQQAYLKAANSGTGDSFGHDVALSADSLLVGSPSESGGTTGINSTPNDLANAAGAAYLFNRAGATWTQAAYIKASNTQHDDGFGMSVAIDGTTNVIGAPNEDSNATGINGDQTNNSANNAGAVYVY